MRYSFKIFVQWIDIFTWPPINLYALLSFAWCCCVSYLKHRLVDTINVYAASGKTKNKMCNKINNIWFQIGIQSDTFLSMIGKIMHNYRIQMAKLTHCMSFNRSVNMYDYNEYQQN